LSFSLNQDRRSDEVMNWLKHYIVVNMVYSKNDWTSIFKVPFSGVCWLINIFHPNRLKHLAARREYESVLCEITLSDVVYVDERVLIDATWDNPNYWFRSIVLVKALGVKKRNLVGIIGANRRSDQRSTLKVLGVSQIFDLLWIRKSASQVERQVDSFCSEINSPADILSCKLPYSVPGKLLYDYLLKRQKLSRVDIHHPEFRKDLFTYLLNIENAISIVEKTKPGLAVVSHGKSETGPLTWICLKNKVKVIVSKSEYGCLRYWRLDGCDDIWHQQDCLSKKELDSLSQERREQFATVGDKAVRKRLAGRDNSLAAQFAYKTPGKIVDKRDICGELNWDSKKKIVAVYASTWFDWPHTYGMKNFLDFEDWITAVYGVAKQCERFNWLIKAHVSDSWYGGVSISDLVDFGTIDHIKLASRDWNGASMLASLDAFVTVHGTVGLEATAIGKPVLVSDVGWYDDHGFVRKPNDRDEFLDLLSTDWWSGMDLAANSKKAKTFAGGYWGRPCWQEEFSLQDDSKQWNLYDSLQRLPVVHKKVMTKESELIKNWYASGHPHYHTYKMLQAKKIQI
tara:strand:+ start:5735 stop:7441 length:1707 start_codon:yes stop_codon:yes gene_type:complete